MAETILAKMAVLIEAQTASFNKALSQSQTQMTSFQKSAQGVSSLLAGFGIGFGVSAIVGEVRKGIDILRNFEKQMDIVQAITGATGKEFDKLRKSALDLGRSTKFTSTEVAELQTEFGRLGFSTQEILDATEATINLSLATGEDLAKSADVAGSTIRGFGLNANQTTRLVDVMAESFNRTALGLENFSEAMKYVAPIAAQAGISVEETTALLGTLADAGIRGSMAGTSLRKIITDLGGESGTLSEKLKKLADKGLTGADAMSEVGRTAYASLLILANNTKKTDDLTEAFGRASGAAQKAADIMGDNLSGDVDKLSSAYEGLILTGNQATVILREIVQAGTAVLTSLGDQSSALSEYIGYWLQLVTVVPRTVAAIAKFVTDADRPLNEINEQLVLLNKLRDQAKQDGNVEAEKKITQAIIDLTNRYKLLKSQVDESNKSNEQVTAVTDEANKKIVEQVGLIGQLENSIKDLEEKKKKSFSTTEIENFNSQISILKSKLEELNSSTGLSNFGKRVIDQQAQQIGTTGTEFALPDVAPKPEDFNEMFPTEFPAPDTSKYLDALKVTTDATQAAGVSAVQSYDQMRLAQDIQIENQQKAAEAAEEYGTAIGDALGSALSGQQSFAQAMKNLTAQLLKTFLARALGGIISSAATAGGPPPVAIALAAAGVAAISAMFSKFTGTSGSGGGGASISAPRTSVARVSGSSIDRSQDINFEAKFKIEGNALVAVVDSVNNRNKRLGG